MKKIGFALIIVLLVPSLLLAKREHTERWYQAQWCKAHEGEIEVMLPDGTRCDCLTETNAIEFDFGNKWAEATGQSAYYALQTQKKAGVNDRCYRAIAGSPKSGHLAIAVMRPADDRRNGATQ